MEGEVVEEEIRTESEVQGIDSDRKPMSVPNHEVPYEEEREITEPEEGTLRILYNNINGMQPTSVIRSKIQQKS